MRGRKPDPAAIKAAKGNPGRRPIAVEPSPEEDDGLDRDLELEATEVEDAKVTAPQWLNTSDLKTDAAKFISALTDDIWRELHGALVGLNLLKSTDENAFARYCRYMAEWIYWTRTLDREGAYYITTSPHVGELKRPHPAFRFRKDVEQSLKELGGELGLTPAARQGIFQRLAHRQPPVDEAAGRSAPPEDWDNARGNPDAIGFLGRLN